MARSHAALRARAALLLLGMWLAPVSGLGPLAHAQTAEAAAPAMSGAAPVLRISDLDPMKVESEALRALVREKRHESLDFVNGCHLGAGTLPPEEEAERLLRIGDIGFAEAQDLRLTEDQRYQEARDACVQTAGCDSATMVEDHTESRRWLREVSTLFRRVLNDNPTYTRADEATWYLGRALLEADQVDEALSLFTSLLKLYPRSLFVPDTWLYIGEISFERKEYLKAIYAYISASRSKDPATRAFARYKLAWSIYQIGDCPNAIATMRAVLRLVPPARDALAGKQIKMIQDRASQDLDRFISDSGEAATACSPISPP